MKLWEGRFENPTAANADGFNELHKLVFHKGMYILRTGNFKLSAFDIGINGAETVGYFFGFRLRYNFLFAEHGRMRNRSGDILFPQFFIEG